MPGTQFVSAPNKPWRLWLIGILGCLWHSLGTVSFVLTQLNVQAVMSGFPPQQREYFASFPLWTDVSSAAGVVAGLIGCVLLLRQNHLAVHACSCQRSRRSSAISAACFCSAGWR